MARASRETWAKRVERWRESGLTAKEFAAELGINEHTLSHWKWKLAGERAAKTARRPSRRGRTAQKAPTAELKLVEVEVAAPGSSPVSYELVAPNGWMLRVPASVDEGTLSKLLRVAGGL